VVSVISEFSHFQGMAETGLPVERRSILMKHQSRITSHALNGAVSMTTATFA
jgi:hypothetical protein